MYNSTLGKENIMKLTEETQEKNIERVLGNTTKVEDYDAFLDEVRKDTEEVFYATDFSDSREDITWDIEGVEFRLSHLENQKDSKYRKYSEQVLRQAYEEVPVLGLKERSTWLYERDYKNASVKLGCLVRDFVSASFILDLGYLMELYRGYNVPCYIDYDNGVFHINAEEPKKENKNKSLGKVVR